MPSAWSMSASSAVAAALSCSVRAAVGVVVDAVSQGGFFGSAHSYTHHAGTRVPLMLVAPTASVYRLLKATDTRPYSQCPCSYSQGK